NGRKAFAAVGRRHGRRRRFRRFSRKPETRSLSKRRLRVHADGKGNTASAGFDADRFRLRDPYGHRRYVYRSEDQRPDRADKKRNSERRRRRNNDDAEFETIA